MVEPPAPPKQVILDDVKDEPIPDSHAEAPKFPEVEVPKNKSYSTILANPPWQEIGGGRIRRGANRHYQLMDTKGIIKLMKQVRIEPSAHLWLWTTNNFLEDGLEVMKGLGFEYRTNIVWVKDRFGIGQYFRGQHELLLFGVKGKALPYKNRKPEGGWIKTVTSVIQSPRTEHSRKPDIYESIELTSYPNYIEIFARNTRDGWDSFGNEVHKFDDESPEADEQ